MRPWPFNGAERQEIGEARAQRLVREGLGALGWTEKELSEKAKGDKGKVKLARQLRAETNDATLDRRPAAHGKLDVRLQPVA